MRAWICDHCNSKGTDASNFLAEVYHSRKYDNAALWLMQHFRERLKQREILLRLEIGHSLELFGIPIPLYRDF